MSRFLPGQAKDLSAPGIFFFFSILGKKIFFKIDVNVSH
jgi:hypothetical protein